MGRLRPASRLALRRYWLTLGTLQKAEAEALNFNTVRLSVTFNRVRDWGPKPQLSLLAFAKAGGGLIGPMSDQHRRPRNRAPHSLALGPGCAPKSL
jgi:hypothetical protein